MSTAPLDILQQLHQAQAQALLARIQSGEATASDFQAANAFLKNNGITVDVNTDKQMQELEAQLAANKARRAERARLREGERDTIVDAAARFAAGGLGK